MSKLHLVIVDREEPYIDALASYLMDCHFDRFKISTFTNEEYLMEFLNRIEGKIDILLIDDQLFRKSLSLQRVRTLIILTNGSIDVELSSLSVIDKYQPASKLVKDIFNILSEDEVQASQYYSFARNKTKVISVYSPRGGIGKTSVAIGCSLLSSERGKRVFYLNLEFLQSTPFFFDCDIEQSFSEVLYYIKDKKKKLSLKVEAMTNEDFESKVHYFSPPESTIDFNEILPEELAFLVNQLRATNQYDVIFVDMTSNLSSNNISILSESDEILLLIDQDEISLVKLENMIKNLEIITKRNNVRILEKMTLVLNKYDSKSCIKLEDIKLQGRSISYKIPKSTDIFVNHNGRNKLSTNSSFTSFLWDLLDNIL